MRVKCLRCGHEADAPVRHVAIMSIECVGGLEEFRPIDSPLFAPAPMSPGGLEAIVYKPPPNPKCIGGCGGTTHRQSGRCAACTRALSAFRKESARGA